MAQIGATFTGIENVESARFTLSHGITPSTGSIQFSPQLAPPPAIGSLALSDGLVTFVLQQCRVDSASITRDSSGLAVSATFMDRRWRWRFGELYGRYNTRDKDNEIIERTRRSLPDLVKLCLEAMQESGTDVSAVPEEPLPEIDWDGDNPAEEIAELLELCNCRIGLDVTGATRIWKAGVGADAPAGPVESRGGDFNPPDPPDSFRVIFGPTVVQARLELEAVGRDTDGSIKLIDDLSYKPESGWETQTDLFTGVAAADEKAIVYCRQSVFKWYRIKGIIDAELLSPPGFGDPFVPYPARVELLDEQVETHPNPDTLEKEPKPAKVYGIYWVRNNGVPKNSSKDDNWECKVRFRVLKDLSIIAFEETVKKFDEETADDPATYEFGPAELFVDIAFTVNDIETGAYHRYGYLYPTGASNGTGPEVISAKDEGSLKVYQKRKSPKDDEYEWAHPEKGKPEALDQKAIERIEEQLGKYQIQQTETLKYSGIMPVPIDGLNVQATLSVGPDGAVTELSRGRESSYLSLPYDQRRKNEKLVRNARKARHRGDGLGLTFIRPTHQGER
jgi:hypothetical protein